MKSSSQKKDDQIASPTTNKIPQPKPYSLFLLLLATAVISLGFINGSLFTDSLKSSQKIIPATFFLKDNYEKLWARVDSCQNKGLTKTALEVVEQICTKAKAENNAPQFVKASLYKMKFWQYKEESSLEKSIYSLDSEVVQSKYPLRPVLQSILADAYWQYYQNNRWKFYNRSATVNFKKDDVSTWSLNDIVNATIKNYVASLQNTDSLKQTAINVYDEVIIKGSGDVRKFRPTLYDFLANRAVDFFKSSEADVNRPANQFHVNDDIFLKSYSEFVHHQIRKPEDSLDLKYHAIKIYQDITKFHENDKEPDALMDVELNRLRFMFSSSQNENKDSLYLNSLRSLADKFNSSKMAAEVYYWMAEFYEGKSSKYDPLREKDLQKNNSETFKWMHKKAVEICEFASKKYPNSYGAGYCDNLVRAIKNTTINIDIESVNEPNQPFRSLVTYKNLPKLYFRLIKMDYKAAKDDMFNDYYGDKLMKKLVKLTAVKTFDYSLPDDGDFNTHKVELKIPELTYGYYILFASNTPDFNIEKSIFAYSRFWNSDLAYINRNLEDGSEEFFVLNRQSGEPVVGATVQAYYNYYDYNVRKYVNRKGDKIPTDQNGRAVVKKNNENDYQNYFNVEITKGEDKLFSENSYSLYQNNYNETEKAKSFLFLDRAIYRPGQTIYFKGIHLTGSTKKNKLLPGKTLTYTLYDVNYQKVSSVDLVTNEYGTVSGTFTAPMGVLNGQMSITDGYGTAYFRVEEYKRPKFETDFNPVKGSFKVNDEITVTGFAKAYAGYNIDGAQVKYRVVRNVRYPSYYYWWYRGYYNNSQTEITSGTLTSNDTGAYIIKFNALPDLSVSKKSSPIYTYNVYADVTDINGETHSASTYVCVGYKMLEMNLSVEEKIEKKELDSVTVSIRNLNGVEEPTAGNYFIYRLKQPEKTFRSRLWEQADKYLLTKEEYYKLFPNDMYADEDDMSKWEREAKVKEGNFDTKKKNKFSIRDLKEEKSGIYLIEGFCKDKNGEEVKDVRFFTLYSESDATAPEKMTDWFYAIKNTGEPGEKASFIQASSLAETKYLYSVEHDNKILSTGFKTASMKPVELDITEEHRGNFAYSVAFIKYNRFYAHSTTITVPYSNKDLDIQFETFRDKLLPGQQEEWKVIIKDKKKEKQTAEMLATMYDASLDAFASNYWNFNIYNYYYNRYYFNGYVANRLNSSEYRHEGNYYHYAPSRYYDRLNYFGLSFYSYNYRNRYYSDDVVGSNEISKSMDGEIREEQEKETTVSRGGKYKKMEAPDEGKNTGMKGDVTTTTFAMAGTATEANVPTAGETGKLPAGKEMGDVKARSNFNETAFFYPQLQTNDKGEIVIKFTVPESLTKWKMMGFAHTKDLKYGMIQKELVTQKDLMVQVNPPRFFREGDKMTFAAKISNLSDKKSEGTAELKFTDPLSGKDLTVQLLKSAAQISFTNAKGQSAPLSWEIEIPFGIQAVTYKVVAKAGNFSDGEEMPLPVLTNRMLVTESMPLPIRSNQTKTFNFDKFVNQNNNSTTLVNHRYTLEFTANPAWYAVQSLPYLMEYPYECAEQTFSRFYANSISSNIANSKPKIKAVFDSWKSQSPEAFLSNLEKNQELKSLLLEETPWVLEAKDEGERKKRVGLLFDLNKMSYELTRAQTKLLKMQSSNGGWPWFEGMPDDWYITQHIVTGMGHLERLGVKKIREDYTLWNAIKKAVYYCDDRMREDYESIKRWDKDYEKNDHTGYMEIQYLYARSYFKDLAVDTRNKTAFNYFMKQAQKYWLSKGRYMQGMLALGLHRYDDKKTPMDIMRSLKENSLTSEEMGMYWKENYDGFYWYEAPIEAQALLIEAFDEVAKDNKAVDDLKVWLLKSKQTQNWQSTKATTEAVYALLLRGTDWLATEPNVTIDLGDIKIDPKNDKDLKAEAGTGYFKKAWSGSDIKPAMGKVTVKKSDEGVSWGAVYWQYFENLDKITPHATPLKLNKKLFIIENTKAGEVLRPIDATTKMKPGDKIKVRIELKVDRDMQYVHMKDMRAAGFEPTNVLSAYKWQDGLGYYQSTKDAATNFFFSNLNKGTYVFEYPLVVSHYGDFSNGVTTIQCMYAPEFTSHSEGIRVKVAK